MGLGVVRVLVISSFLASEDFEKNPSITLLGCLAHARRKFVEAQSDDRERAEYVLTLIQELYAIERHASELGMDYQQRYELRQEKFVPILETLEKWMTEQYAITPSSNLGQAIVYSLKRWKKLTLYTKDGKLNPDNNWVENAIRPIALGYVKLYINWAEKFTCSPDPTTLRIEQL